MVHRPTEDSHRCHRDIAGPSWGCKYKSIASPPRIKAAWNGGTQECCNCNQLITRVRTPVPDICPGPGSSQGKNEVFARRVWTWLFAGLEKTARETPVSGRSRGPGINLGATRVRWSRCAFSGQERGWRRGSVQERSGDEGGRAWTVAMSGTKEPPD